jgi:predicted  nucleic acid-binding Zn-ribbon protein
LILDLQNMSADGFRSGAEQITKAHDLLETVRTDFASRGKSAAHAVKQIMGAVQRLRKASTETGALRQTIAGLEEQLGLRVSELSAQKEMSLQFEKRLSEQEHAFQAAKQRVAELERQATEAQHALESERTARAALQQQLDDTENAVNARNVDIAEGRKEVEGLKHGLAEKEQELLHLENRLQTLEKEKNETDVSRSTQRTELDKIQTELDKTRVELDAVRTNKKVSDAEIVSLKEKLENALAETAGLHERLSKASDAAGRAAELEAALNAANERVNTLEARLKEEMADVARASSVAEQLAQAAKEQHAPRQELQPQQTGMTGGAAPEKPGAPAAPSFPETEGRRWKLGEILWEMGVITLEQLEDALEEQRLNPQAKLGTILEEKGYASPEAVAQAVALRAETAYVEVDAQSIAPDVAGLIPARLASLHKCIPIRADGDTLTLAMANALDIVAIEDVERISQRRVEPVVATLPRILELIDQLYERSPSARR